MSDYHLPEPIGLYDPRFEHDSCGVGFIADIGGKRSHDTLSKGITALASLLHRGAVAGDGASGDGAGVLTQIPQRLFAREVEHFHQNLRRFEDLAVGMFFLPQNWASRDRCMTIVEEILSYHDLNFIGWRQVPTDAAVLGDKARATMPEIMQALVKRRTLMNREEYQRLLYLARRDIESEVTKLRLKDFYICSFSNQTVVYKALMGGLQLRHFYADLQNPDYETAICLFHQRYSTNTFPTWPMAQPFRFLGHNGEINTIEGNRNWMRARAPELQGGQWNSKQLRHLKLDFKPTDSDSCSLDNVLELLVMSGRRDLLHAMMMLIPEAYQNMPHMNPELQGFYEYHTCLIEPWDGPAAVAFSDGEVVAACLDRNGLRPARYVVTDDDLVIMGSETGLIEVPPKKIVAKGRLGPGKMIAVDTRHHRLLLDDEIKMMYARRRPYAAWIRKNLVRVNAEKLNAAGWGIPPFSANGSLDELQRQQTAFGYTHEDVERLIEPMAAEGKEAVGSMGDDTPLAVFSEKPRPLYHYFKQRFAQVTNPPIDPMREKLVMSMRAKLGARHSLLDETPEHARMIKFPSPIISNAELAWVRSLKEPEFQSATLDATFAVSTGEEELERAVIRLSDEVLQAVDDGKSIIILSDKSVGPQRAPIPILLSVAAAHHHLIRRSKRMRCTLVCETGEPREEHHFAALIGYGAVCINPYLAFRTVAMLAETGRLNGLAVTKALQNYRTAVENGVLKIMSKMGISTISGYRGAQVFETVGLSQELIDAYFTGTPSRLGGIGLREIARDTLKFHEMAYGDGNMRHGEVEAAGEKKHGLADFGFYRYRQGGEYHQYNPDVFKAMHQLSRSGKTGDYAKLAALIENRPPAALRDLLTFKKAKEPVPLEEVEPVASIVKRFVASGMSHGALSREAHECIAIAMNRLGAKSNSGEGGEDPSRYHRLTNDDSANSAIKQIASARFGVTAAYLANARELEIKMAQGSKPGEGGQLPGAKVSEEIARIRHSTPGVTLISPPPHHDIYSIEDLAQLIYDLKQGNPAARVAVKLVSQAGVGTIAAGVCKAYADVVQISGHDGGTGASPWGSIKNVGLPWELGLAEAQQTLVLNDLRGRILVRVDGGLKSGRDVMVAALLGAEEYGFGSAVVVAASCVMARQCHLNTCPVGVATQDPSLRQRFKGKPEHVVNYLLGVAQDVREILGAMGYRRLDEVIGRVDLLEVGAGKRLKPDKVLLDFVLTDPARDSNRPRQRVVRRNTKPGSSLDDLILPEVKAAIESHSSITREYEIRNIHRTAGAKVAGAIAALYGDCGFDGTIELRFRGTAGQSFGAFCIKGLRLILTGEANDYIGKSMNGGVIVIRPPAEIKYSTHKNSIVGNTVMYGATGGKLFAAGMAGERFCVRNSGGEAVIEGVGDHGCEYMTGGRVVVLGRTGRNFAAGMTGGLAYVLDEVGDFEKKCNQQLVDIFPVTAEAEIAKIRALLEEHYRLTCSPRGKLILDQWEQYLPKFRKVQPHPPAKTAAATAMMSATRLQKRAVTRVEGEKEEVPMFEP